MSPSLAAPAIVLALVLASDAWVAWDASRQVARGRDVSVTIGPVTLDRPEHWVVACLLVWLVAFPLYLVARREP